MYELLIGLGFLFVVMVVVLIFLVLINPFWGQQYRNTKFFDDLNKKEQDSKKVKK